jgi:hypothetical protein
MPAAMVFVRPTLIRFIGKSREKEMRVQNEKMLPNFIGLSNIRAKEYIGIS